MWRCASCGNDVEEHQDICGICQSARTGQLAHQDLPESVKRERDRLDRQGKLIAERLRRIAVETEQEHQRWMTLFMSCAKTLPSFIAYADSINNATNLNIQYSMYLNLTKDAFPFGAYFYGLEKELTSDTDLTRSVKRAGNDRKKRDWAMGRFAVHKWDRGYQVLELKYTSDNLGTRTLSFWAAERMKKNEQPYLSVERRTGQRKGFRELKYRPTDLNDSLFREWIDLLLKE